MVNLSKVLNMTWIFCLCDLRFDVAVPTLTWQHFEPFEPKQWNGGRSLGVAGFKLCLRDMLLAGFPAVPSRFK